MIWNRETRYTPYNAWPKSTLPALTAQVATSKWRLQHHIQPASGLLNDPNGFAYFNHQWQLSYQVFPYGPVHGLKAWQHLTSTDLIHWHDEGLAIQPDSKYDSHGAYTGTAIPVGDRLFIMYTGNVRDADWNRHAYQIGAWMDTDNQVKKINPPMIMAAPVGYTTSFRDPDLFERNGEYYALIGAQTTANLGAALLYHSSDLKQWDLQGELDLPAELRGYMVECPNLVEIDGQPVLIFCPQGLPQTTLPYENIYPNVSLVGTQFDLDQVKFTAAGAPTQLDAGFDVYATQAFNAPDGRALAVSWIGLPEIGYPTDSENWAHCLSLVKELTLKDNHLYQNPVIETKRLRENAQVLQAEVTSLTGAFETELTLAADEQVRLKVATTDAAHYLLIDLDSQTGTVTIDRRHIGHPFAEKYGQTRTTQVLRHTALKLRLIIDVSVFECYINNGYTTMTGRFFLDDAPTQLQLAGNVAAVSGTVWNWRK